MEERVTFFDQLFYSIAKPKEYTKLTKLKAGRVVSYVAVIMILCTIISYLIPIAGFIASVQGFKNFFTNRLPAFELNGDTFSIEDNLDFMLGNLHVVANDEMEVYSEDDIPEDESTALYISQSNMLAVSGANYANYKFTEMKKVYDDAGLDLYVDNQTFVETIPMLYLCIAFMFVMMLLGNTFNYVLLGLLFAAFGFGFNKMSGADLSFGKVFAIALYAETLMALLTKIAGFFVGPIISFVIWLILAMMTSSLVNRAISEHAPKSNSGSDMFNDFE